MGASIWMIIGIIFAIVLFVAGRMALAAVSSAMIPIVAVMAMGMIAAGLIWLWGKGRERRATKRHMANKEK